jgi:hypothetical protein
MFTFRKLNPLLVLLAWGIPAVATAQGRSPTPSAANATRTPVLVALSASAGSPYQLIQHPRGALREIIVLPAAATDVELSDAVRAVLLSRTHGRSNANSTLVRVRTSSPRAHRPLPWTSRILSDLRHAPTQNVDGVGRVPTVQIWLPGRPK